MAASAKMFFPFKMKDLAKCRTRGYLSRDIPDLFTKASSV